MRHLYQIQILENDLQLYSSPMLVQRLSSVPLGKGTGGTRRRSNAILHPRRFISSVVVLQKEEKRGTPADAVDVSNLDLPALQPGQAQVKMLAAPINPSDINILEGVYKYKPTLPAVPGLEGVGVVEEVGPGVSDLKAGSRVIHLPGWFSKKPQKWGTWCQRHVVDKQDLYVVKDDVPVEQAAMMIVNPLAAWKMLHNFVKLQPGDWIVQNAANSGVGLNVIQIAKHLGYRTINIVRREELIPTLKAEGADIVVTDKTPLPDVVKDITKGEGVKLGLNAVGGKKVVEMAKVMAPHSYLVTYGAMSKEPLTVPNSFLIFQDIKFVGYISTYHESTPEELDKILQELTKMAAENKLRSFVDSTFPLTEAKTAITKAYEGSRNGKILFKMY